MKSTLSLDITNNGDCKSFRITDSSYYNPTIPVTCIHLLIKTPVNSIPVEFEYEAPYFSSVFNTANLKIQNPSSLNECVDILPDGVYYIKYSINPNDRIYVEYNYLHNCSLLQMFISAYCNILSQKCNLTQKEFEDEIKKLTHIKELIDGAKYLVEYCNKPDEGMDLYNEALKLLNKNNSNGRYCSSCK